MSNQPPAGPPEGWEPQPQGEGSERPTEPQWPTQGAQWGTQPPTQPPTQPTEPHEQPTEPQAERWETYGPPAPPGQDHSAWAAQRREILGTALDLPALPDVLIDLLGKPGPTLIIRERMRRYLLRWSRLPTFGLSPSLRRPC